MRLYVILAGLFTCAAAGPALAGPMAEATAYVSILSSGGDDLAFSDTISVQSTSSGNGIVSVSETANAKYISADVVASLDGYGESYVSEGVSLGVTITNVSSLPFSGALVSVDFSASRGSGASIDQASTDVGSTEAASFSSVLGGTGAGDFHTCSLSPSAYEVSGAEESTTGGQNYCTVPSPDFDVWNFYVYLDPGESETLGTYALSVSAQVAWTPVPEPASINLFVSSIVALTMLRCRAWRGAHHADPRGAEQQAASGCPC